jgi:hypothetical protein
MRPPPRLVSSLVRLVLPALLLLAGLVALATSCGPSKLELQRRGLERSLAVLADSGDVEAGRVIADIEVLRADGMFSDSLANVLTAMPANEFLAIDDKGVLSRTGRGVDITALLAYTAAEPMLIKEMAITPEQAAEVRRLAKDNMTAAAEMATSFGSKGSERAP